MQATALVTEEVAESPLLLQLGTICHGQGLLNLADRLADLQELVRDDLTALEEILLSLSLGPSIVEKSGAHLLSLGGKRLRPLCVLLAAHGNDREPSLKERQSARELAVAVELVHSATLLHDDVVDLGDKRRGAPSARVLYGNSASIFAGDYLLIEAIRRVRRARVEGALDHLLDVIDEMILAEALQLESRGRIVADRKAYFRVVEGKTAALFRWAMAAGGRAGGLPQSAYQALEQYGMHLGVAFQAADDMLDLAGNAKTTGKALFTDLREGKMTFPLIVALEREPDLLSTLETIAKGGGIAEQESSLMNRVLETVHRTGALSVCKDMAKSRVVEALRALSLLPKGRAQGALRAVAEAAVERDH